MHKTSKGDTLININDKKLKDVKDEIFNAIAKSSTNSKIKNCDKKDELIGTLPSALIDLKKFPTNEDLNKFAEMSLNFQIPFWKKRSRHEIIGRIITEIDNKEGAEFDLFFSAWNNFITENDDKKSDLAKKDFVSLWLDFFDHYKGNR
jgi:hypothetical protein